MNLHNSLSVRLGMVAKASLATAMLAVWASAAAALLAVGCSPSSPVTFDQAPSSPVTFAQVRPLLKSSCALSSSCHAISTASQGNLALTDAEAYCALVGATKGATYRTTAKTQYPHRVVPSDTASSYLYRKLTLATADSGTTTPLGTVMPLNQPLDAASIDVFARWITGGAQNDDGTNAPAGCN